MLNALDELLPTRLVLTEPSTVCVSLPVQPEHSRTARILTYIPVRASPATIDIIEERTPVDNLTLTLNIPHKLHPRKVGSRRCGA